jgi:hypothetical protein
MEDWARQSNGVACQARPGQVLACALLHGGPGWAKCWSTLRRRAGQFGWCVPCYAAVLIFIPAGSVEGVEEAQGADPNQARSYFPHSICRYEVYSNQARSELPTSFVT